ncbi:MAG: acyl-CoA reductase [Crocinitomicaceae bacterium]|nr:acyl-CoA reductase [Crocinitomicaceae bacterium]
MNRDQIISAFSQLGAVFQSLGNGNEYPGTTSGIIETEFNDLQIIINKQVQYNGWFTKENVRQSLTALSSWLTKEELTNWLAPYNWSDKPKRVGIIMAGNIPLVGFHDLLCVVASGNTAVCKMSSEDKTLLPAFVNILFNFLPELNQRILLSAGKIGEIDAVIATGSNNSALYFEQYFGKYPHIFRKNRTSLAVLTGKETKEELTKLGEDIFAYFGLGCRNVSHLLVPENYDFKLFFEAIFQFGDIINHHKYCNNYDYNKAVYLLNLLPILDNNFILLRESIELHSPLAMLHYHTYENQQDIQHYITQHKDELQVVVGHGYTDFGAAQCPSLSDYADDVDTMNWLNTL